MSHIANFDLKLKALRTLHNMYQTELCERTGINRQLLVDYEQGRSFPGPAHLAAIEEALGVKFDTKTDDAFNTLLGLDQLEKAA